MKAAARSHHPSELAEDGLEWSEQQNRRTGTFDYSHPGGDESDSTEKNRQSTFFNPDPQKHTREYHVDQAIQAIQLLKAASRNTGWKRVVKHKSGCLVHQSTDSNDKHPAFKGEHVIRGFRAQDVFSVVGVRKLWDDWYDELSLVESYDDATNLMYMVMKGTMSSKTRDISMVERIEVERDGTIYFASCSVESNQIPRISGKVRADIFVAGWIIQPLPSNPPITKVTYIIQTDLLSRLPKFMARRALAKRPLVITTIETHLKKSGVPMVMSNIVSQTTNRHRSLSEPLKPDKFLFAANPGKEEVLQSGSAFLSPIGPIKSDKDIEQLDDKETMGDDDLQRTLSGIDHHPHRRDIRNSLAPSLASSRSLAPSIFSSEFLESNAALGDTAMFGDSDLFGKGGIYESQLRHQEEVVLAAEQSRTINPKSPTLAHNRVKSPVSPQPMRTLPVEADSMNGPPAYSAANPAVTQISDDRVKQGIVNEQQHLTADRSIMPAVVTPATPPLTPTASIDGRDPASDSDASMTSRVKIVPRVPKLRDSAMSSRPNSMAFAAYGVRPPSAIMEARRHSTLIGRNSTFAPRHSHALPVRNNSNTSQSGLHRSSTPISQLSGSMKRHSNAPSVDSNRSSTLTASTLAVPHRHSETVRKALAMFKVLASSPEDRWRAVSNEGGFKSYSRIISGAGLPMMRGEGIISGGWTVEQINAVIESAGCRQVWDERFENMSIAETFNSNEYLFHITLRDIDGLTGRDLAGVTIIDRDPQTCALYNVSTSVLDPTIPEDPGCVRAVLEMSGWSLRPIFDGQGNTVSVHVTFVIQIDIRGTLPSSVVKSVSSGMMSSVSRLNQFINKTGCPPYPSFISGTRLLDTFEPKTGYFELCYKASPGWTEIRVGRKVYRDGYDFFIKPDDPTVRVELAPDFGGVRVFTTLDHEGQSIIAQVTRKGQSPISSATRQQQQLMQQYQEQHEEDEEDEEKEDESPIQDISPYRARSRDSRMYDPTTTAPTYGGPSLRKSPGALKSFYASQGLAGVREESL